MGKKVIGILGSPLTDGNTAQLFEQALKGAKDAGCEVEKIVIVNLDFQACQEMMFCKEHETCILDDDMQALYPKLRETDGIIIATPVMTMGIPGKLKSFIDRFQVFFMAKYVRKKSLVSDEKKKGRKGLFICISGMNIPEVFVGVKLTIKAFFDIIDCQYSDELLISDMDHILDIRSQPVLLETAYKKGFALGKSLGS
ncbi:MAG: flavodoxin family protein [Methanoregula sp.]|nr:flavodoxin family protein [Methanoregula sp.]